MLWPGVTINGRRTINVERGFNSKIADRMDLTLECLRRDYNGEDNPMTATIAAYGSYFALFENFRNFVDFFLLQDLVTDDYTAVTFFMPFDDFKGPSTPKDIDTYREYRRLSIEFVMSRNRRIDHWQSGGMARVTSV